MNTNWTITEGMIEAITTRIDRHHTYVVANKRDTYFLGDCADVFCNRPLSKQQGKSHKGQADCWVVVDGNYYKAEAKVNGGQRIKEIDTPYIILFKTENELLYRDTTVEEVIEVLTSAECRIVKRSTFEEVKPYRVKADGKSEILYKSKKFDKWMATLPEFTNTSKFTKEQF